MPVNGYDNEEEEVQLNLDLLVIASKINQLINWLWAILDSLYEQHTGEELWL